MSELLLRIYFKKVKSFTILLLLFLLVACFNVTGQDVSKIHLAKFQKLNKVDYSRTNIVLTCIDQNSLYFLNYDNVDKQKGINLTVYDAETLSFIYKKEVDIPDTIVSKIFSSRKQLVFINNSLYILGFKGLIELKLTNDKYVFDNIYSYPEVGFDRISKLNDSTIVLATFYNFHYKEGLPRFVIGTFNIETKNFYILKKEVKPLGIELSHFVNEFIAFNNDMVAVANPVLNEIEIYRIIKFDEIILVNTILLDHNNSGIKRIFLEDTSAINMYQVPIKWMMYNIDSLSRKYSVQRIQKIFFIDQETILISWFYIEEPNVRYLQTVKLENNKNIVSKLSKHSVVDSLSYEESFKIHYSTPIFWHNGDAITHTIIKPQSLKSKEDQSSFYWLKYSFNLP